METARKWINQAGVEVEYILSLDESEPTNDRTTGASRYVTLFNAHIPNYKVCVNPNDCVVQATNHAAAASTGDVLIYLSDDFDCFPNWGQVITEICSRYTGEYMVKVDDGLQKFENTVLTIPIMSRKLYERLGYFFHPDYKSMWVDVDLYYTCARMRPLDGEGQILKFHKEIRFQHNHYSNGKTKKDETYTRSDGFWNQGKEVLARRRAEHFR